MDKWNMKIGVEFALLFPEGEREEATDFVAGFPAYLS